MATFDESKHKRDELGRFAEMSTSELKKRQEIKLAEAKRIYDTTGGVKTYRQNTPYQEILVQDKESFTEYKTKRLQSIVFDRISTYRKKLNQQGYAIFSVNDGERFYQIRLFGGINNYEYEILSMEEIDSD